MYEVAAIIAGGFADPDVVCAFDPSKVVARLCQQFPGAEVDPTDHAWRDYNAFLAMGLSEERQGERWTALGVAASDARRRGPLWAFRVPAPDGGWVRGSAERHRVWFHGDEPFPELLQTELVRFVEGLRFASCVSVRCGWSAGEYVPDAEPSAAPVPAACIGSGIDEVADSGRASERGRSRVRPSGTLGMSGPGVSATAYWFPPRQPIHRR